MEIIKLTQDEINTLSSFQKQNEELIINFGQIEMSIQNLEIQKERLKQELTNLKNLEFQIGKDLQNKYGDGNINIETGEFIKLG
jgi:stress response protein YsnF